MSEKRPFSDRVFDGIDMAAELVGVGLATMGVMAVPVVLIAQSLIYLRTGAFPKSLCALHQATGLLPEATLWTCLRPQTEWRGLNEILAWTMNDAPAALVCIGFTAACFVAMLGVVAVLHAK